MKTLMILLLSIVGHWVFAQGNFASAPWKALVGKSCKNEKEFPLLKDFTSQGGTLLSDVNDPEKKSVALFAKGSTIIALFESQTDQTITVVDVIEIKNILKTQDLKIGTCRDGDSDNPYIMALTEQSKQKRWKAVKAWHFNLDKIRVEAWPHANVTCLGIEGDD